MYIYIFPWLNTTSKSNCRRLVESAKRANNQATLCASTSSWEWRRTVARLAQIVTGAPESRMWNPESETRNLKFGIRYIYIYIYIIMVHSRALGVWNGSQGRRNPTGGDVARCIYYEDIYMYMYLYLYIYIYTYGARSVNLQLAICKPRPHHYVICNPPPSHRKRIQRKYKKKKKNTMKISKSLYL